MLPTYLSTHLSSYSTLTRLVTRNLVCGLAVLALASCRGGYTYTLNDSVIYSPTDAGNPTASVLRDSALQACLNQVLKKDQRPVKLEDVRLLACPGSGVETLIGIENLPHLEQLELSDNQIHDLKPLTQLRDLRVLALRNNPVASIEPLLSLPALRFVSLQGAEQLPCKELAKLKTKLGNTLSEPLHCTE
jgi:Leucine-rich repeat (LRR) protein